MEAMGPWLNWSIVIVICLPTERLGVLKNSGKRVCVFQIELVFGSVGFYGEGKTAVHGEEPLEARERTNNKVNPHMASTPGFEPGPMVGGECSHHCVTLAPQCRQWLESTLEHVRPLTKKNIVKNDWKTTFKEYHTWAFVVVNSNHLSEITGKWHEYVQVSFKA